MRRTLLPLGFASALAGTAAAQIAFNAPVVVPTGQRAEGLVFADFNADGARDLAVATEGTGNQDLVEIFRNDGAGNFAFQGSVNLGSNTGPSHLAAGDFDGDGDVDLAVSLHNSNQVRVLANNGGFSFSAGAATGTGGSNSRQISAADMDGDGDLDLVVSNRDSSNVSVLRNTGGTMALIGTFQAGSEVRDNAVGDFNGDGRPDVAAASHDSRQVAFLMNTGSGALGAATFLPVPNSTRPEGMEAVDFDGDGDIDVLAGTGDDNSPNQNFVSLYRNNGGVFSGPTTFTTGGLDTGNLFVGDLDGDGDVDAVTTNESSSNLSVMTNTGGSLSMTSLIAIGSEPSEIAGADVDGNGSIDLGVTLRQQAGVRILDNQGSGGGPFANYCSANVNSSGLSARMSGSGNGSVATNNTSITCSRMPQNAMGYFLTSQNAGFVGNPGGSAGNLCLSGSIGRYSNLIQSSGATGSISIQLDLNALPLPVGTAQGIAGQTWRFQCWFRDQVGGVPTSNFSDGLAITLS